MIRGRFNIVSLTDWHCPFHDRLALEAAIEFCGRHQPQVIVVHELHDFYALSSFDKDPERITGLQDEIDMVTGYLSLLREVCPQSRIILLKSNHLDRLRRYLWKKAPALASLRSLKIEKLLELKRFQIEYLPYFEWQGVLFKHGNIVRKDAGMTARAELSKEGVSGVSGHTHRLAQVYRRKRGGEYTWIESGCLCDLNPTYVEGTADWQHGLALVSFKRKDSQSYWAVPLPIIEGRLPF